MKTKTTTLTSPGPTRWLLIALLTTFSPASPAETAIAAETKETFITPEAAEALNHPNRPEQDRLLDSKRKPAEIVTFFEISRGMQVLDIFAGGGYYTEIMSYVVGPEGTITMYNNNPWNNFVRQAADARLSNNRLPNVERLTLVPEALGNVEPGYDAAIFVLGMHDLYYEDLGNDWPMINVQTFLANIYRLLKPGAVFGVIDHIGTAGSDPAEIGKSLHRIDPAVIIRDIEAAGFTLEASSDLLRNPEDDLSGLVFAPELRWQSDRSVLRFRKPLEGEGA